MGTLRVVTAGNLPLNPIALQNADPAVAAVLAMRPKIYEGIFYNPGPYMSAQGYVLDKDKNVQAWLRGDIADFDTAMKRADDNTTREAVRRLVASLKQYGLTDVPAACVPFK